MSCVETTQSKRALEKESFVRSFQGPHVHVHVHVHLPSRQDAQPQVPWKHIVEGADRIQGPHGQTHITHKLEKASVCFPFCEREEWFCAVRKSDYLSSSE